MRRFFALVVVATALALPASSSSAATCHYRGDTLADQFPNVRHLRTHRAGCGPANAVAYGIRWYWNRHHRLVHRIGLHGRYHARYVCRYREKPVRGEGEVYMKATCVRARARQRWVTMGLYS